MGGTTTSTKQFVWCGDERCEVHDGAGALVSQYFHHKQVNVSGGVGTSYYYTLDHLGSVRELTDSSGNVAAQLSYDAYGRVSQLKGSIAPDFQYAAYYVHQRSGLDVTRTRAYATGFARFINPDPIGEVGGFNLYGYVANRPTQSSDQSGMQMPPVPPFPMPTPRPPLPPNPSRPQPWPNRSKACPAHGQNANSGHAAGSSDHDGGNKAGSSNNGGSVAGGGGPPPPDPNENNPGPYDKYPWWNYWKNQNSDPYEPFPGTNKDWSNILNQLENLVNPDSWEGHQGSEGAD